MNFSDLIYDYLTDAGYAVAIDKPSKHGENARVVFSGIPVSENEVIPCRGQIWVENDDIHIQYSFGDSGTVTVYVGSVYEVKSLDMLLAVMRNEIDNI